MEKYFKIENLAFFVKSDGRMLRSPMPCMCKHALKDPLFLVPAKITKRRNSLTSLLYLAQLRIYKQFRVLAFLVKILKFKMAAIIGKSFLLRYPRVKNFTKITLSHTFMEIQFILIKKNLYAYLIISNWATRHLHAVYIPRQDI